MNLRVVHAQARVVCAWLGAALALALTACAPQLVRPDAALLAAQTVREQTLAVHADWSLAARLAVSDGRDGGSGSLEWVQDGASFSFTVRAPVTGKTWRLSGDSRHALLEGADPQPIAGPDAASLLESRLGWHVPVAELQYWVRGLRAPGTADLEFRPDGLPAELTQAGWRVEYLDYDETLSPPLPRKVFASRGEYRVRLVVSHWQLK